MCLLAKDWKCVIALQMVRGEPQGHETMSVCSCSDRFAVAYKGAPDGQGNPCCYLLCAKEDRADLLQG